MNLLVVFVLRSFIATAALYAAAQGGLPGCVVGAMLLVLMTPRPSA